MDRKTKIIQIILMVTSILFLINMGYLVFVEGIDANLFQTNLEIVVFSFAILSFTISCSLALYPSKLVGEGFGYRPSRELDKAIHKVFLSRCTKLKIIHELSPYDYPKYSTKIKYANRLLLVFSDDSVSCSRNVATGAYVCTYEGHTATAASYEMALCIAFLKANGHEDVK